MKLDARQLVARILPRNDRDPPPPYSPSPGAGLQRERSRPLPTPPAPRPQPQSQAPRDQRAQRIPSPSYQTLPASRSLSTSTPQRPSTSASSGIISRSGSRRTHPSPPYADTWERRRSSKVGLAALPLGVVHRILAFTLDPRATPEKWAVEPEIDRIHRLTELFRDLRAVDRRFFLVATAILRERFLPAYYAHLLPGMSSSPLPPTGDSDDPTAASVFQKRSREAAVLDRFIAVRIGEERRKAESELNEELGEEFEIFNRLQPTARVEDLLLSLPRHLVRATAPQVLLLEFPLPHTHLAVNLSPLWAQVYLCHAPVSLGSAPKGRAGRQLVAEVKRERTPEETVYNIRQAFDYVAGGIVAWGSRVV